MTGRTSAMLRTATLLVWSAFFAWLMISGEVYRYIGPRTRWVVVLGACILAVAAAVQVRAVLSGPPRDRPVSRGDLVGFLSLLAPIAIVLVVPKPSLGSDAAARKSTGTFISAAGSFGPVAVPGGDVSFREIAYASESKEYAAAAGITDGYEIELTGFVTHPDDRPDGTFALTRFATFCCAADAVPYSVVVYSDRDYPDDQWLRVSGVLVERKGEFVVDPERVVRVDEPQNPYI